MWNVSIKCQIEANTTLSKHSNIQTYKPLNKVIINYFDSNGENLAQKINRCMAMEYDNPDKKAKIYIISSTEDVELKWLKRALEFFDKSKIKYV